MPDGPLSISRSERKRTTILDAAEQIFLRDGYLGSGMDEIAVASHASKQTVYAHFGSKEALFIDVVGRMTGATSDRVHHPVPAAVDRSAISAYLTDYAERQLGAVLDPKVVRLRRLVIGEAARFPELGRELWEKGPERALTALAEALAELDRRGVLAIDDARRAASQFNWLVMGDPLNRAMLLSKEPARSNREYADHAAEAVEAFLRIYGAR